MDELINKVIDLKGLVDYQESTIVSRQIIIEESGDVTIFAMSKGQEIQAHSAPFDALVQVLEGEGIYTIDNEDKKVKAGEILIMPANILHAIKAEENFKWLLTKIKK